MVDCTFAAFPPTPINYFFTTKLSPETAKLALKHTLDAYHHITGNVVITDASAPGHLTVEYGSPTDRGVLFTTATWDAPLETVLPTQVESARTQNAIAPAHPALCGEGALRTILPVPMDGHLAVAQLTTFTNGSVLALRVLHSLMDAHAAIVFVNAWAKTYSALVDGKVPELDTTVFDPSRLTQFIDKRDPATIAEAAKSINWEVPHAIVDSAMLGTPLPPFPEFQLPVGETRQILLSFSPDEIERAHAAAAAKADEGTYLSRLDVMLGIIWTAVVRARAASLKEEMLLSIAVGMRSRLNPKLGYGYVGSPCFSTRLTMPADEVNPASVARGIRSRLDAFTPETIPAMLAVMDRTAMPPLCLDFKFGPSFINSTSWLACDMYGAVFGEGGAPVLVQPGLQGVNGIIVLLRTPRPAGVKEGKWHAEGLRVMIGVAAEATDMIIAEVDRLIAEL